MALTTGARVLISGLNGRPELNGTHGIILSFDEGKGRFAVKLSSNNERILLKPANLADVPAPAGCDPLADLDYDALLEGPDFSALRVRLLQASSRPGAKSYAQKLRGAAPFGMTPLKAIVSLLSEDEPSAPLVQQACDALSKVCTLGHDARTAVRAAHTAPALVATMHGFHSVSKTLERCVAAARAEVAAEAAGAAAGAGVGVGQSAARPADLDDEPRIVDVTDEPEHAAASQSPEAMAPLDADVPSAAAGGAAGRQGVEDVEAAEPSPSELELVAKRAAAAAAAADGPDPASSDANARLAGRTLPTDPLLVTRACCHALCNLANGDLACKQAVVGGGGAAAIADAVRAATGDHALAKIAVGGLANIAGGDAACVNAVLGAFAASPTWDAVTLPVVPAASIAPTAAAAAALTRAVLDPAACAQMLAEWRWWWMR